MVLTFVVARGGGARCHLARLARESGQGPKEEQAAEMRSQKKTTAPKHSDLPTDDRK